MSVLFARATDAAVGSFHYPLGLVEFSLSEDAKALLQDPAAAAAKDRDTETLIRLAYEAASYLHEMRHFVDTLGTLAGLSLFAGRLELLKEFAALSAGVRQHQGSWPQPPQAWALDPAAPQAVRDFVRRARAFDGGQRAYLAPLKPLEVEGHLEDLRIEVPVEGGGSVDASPLRVEIKSADGGTRSRSVIYPLGLEALFEGSAHAVSRTYVERAFPPAVGKAFERRTLAVDASKGERGQRAAQTATPYMVVDILITRYLRAHGVETFSRDLVLALVDRVLATSAIRAVEMGPGKTAMHVDRVGLKLHELLEGTDVAVLKGTELPPDPKIEPAYRGLLESYEAGGTWQTVHDDLSPLASIRIWESWLAKTYVVPLLRARLDTQGRAFSTHAGFLDLMLAIGSPPVRVANGTLGLADAMPDRVKQAWVGCMMLGELMWQSARSSGAVLCPRAHRTVPGLATMELSFAGHCNAHQLLGCGTHGGASPSTHRPSCLFENTLQTTGLKAAA